MRRHSLNKKARFVLVCIFDGCQPIVVTFGTHILQEICDKKVV